MADDALDELYAQSPDGFTVTRTELAKQAKQRGDTQAAKEIAAARRPTKAAWVVNLLAIRDPSVRKQLGTLGERLRAAHQTMDGKRIRELSAEQRHLIDALADKAFRLAQMAQPVAAVREDVVGTLQAAVAGPEVADALGRLAKPESWSGFAEGVERADEQEDPEPAKPTAREKREQQERQRERAKAQSLVHAAERERDAAQKRLDDAQRKLDDAEQVLAEAKRRLERSDDGRSDRRQQS
ncbi:hypothetical protein [Mycobacterium sp. EPa45]|uniref:hypothetical protein n=1 Tax=Mycobacterium sp. EPa45 TaxID=1545728 RepID=UPI0006421A10|nr:hypothetical protein [Mycobacterium sp. EPa45]AKK27558.1 hypothetical protein AB431_13720 [Mycobacterium sp. EPa45]